MKIFLRVFTTILVLAMVFLPIVLPSENSGPGPPLIAFGPLAVLVLVFMIRTDKIFSDTPKGGKKEADSSTMSWVVGDGAGGIKPIGFSAKRAAPHFREKIRKPQRANIYCLSP